MATKFKNIRMKKKGGGTRMQRVQVLKSGKFKFVKNIKKGSKPKKKATTKMKATTRKKSTTGKKNNPKGGRKMAKKGKKKGKRSLVTWARLGVYALAASQKAIAVIAVHGFSSTSANRIAQAYTGRDNSGRLTAAQAKDTYGALAAVAIVDTIASKAGVYKRISNL